MIDIFVEYEEVLFRYMGNELIEYVLQFIENVLNVFWIIKYFKWQFVKLDVDDNKFVDCVIVSNVDFIVSNDKYFVIIQYVCVLRI